MDHQNPNGFAGYEVADSVRACLSERVQTKFPRMDFNLFHISHLNSRIWKDLEIEFAYQAIEQGGNALCTQCRE